MLLATINHFIPSYHMLACFKISILLYWKHWIEMLKKQRLCKYNKNSTMVKIFFMSDRKDFLYVCGLWIWIWLSYSFDIITSPSCVFASPSSFPFCWTRTFIFFPSASCFLHSAKWTSAKKLPLLLSEISKYITLHSCCCQGWPENSPKREVWHVVYM